MTAFHLPDGEPVIQRIRQAATRRALSHALLITGQGDRETVARFAAAALECTAEGPRPCLACPNCRKVLENIHPDVTTVVPKETKNLSVDQIRELRSDAYIRPNEGARKIYIFPDCGLLTDRDQNVLLKIVEEGPPYAAFLFCAEHGSAVLQTLRSRCVELKLRPSGQRSDAQEGPAETFCRALASRRRSAVVECAIRMENRTVSREDLAAFLERSIQLCAAAELMLYGKQVDPEEREIAANLAKTLTKRQMMRTIELLQKYREECKFNVGPNHVLCALAVELEEIL